MKRLHILARPTRTDDLSFEDFYDEISRDWEYKARKLQARRWRALSHGNKLSTSDMRVQRKVAF